MGAYVRKSVVIGEVTFGEAELGLFLSRNSCHWPIIRGGEHIGVVEEVEICIFKYSYTVWVRRRFLVLGSR